MDKHEDPLVNKDSEKAQFFRAGEEWRRLYPEDFQPLNEEVAARETAEEKRIDELEANLSNSCFFCSGVVEDYESDCLIETPDGTYYLGHYHCGQEELRNDPRRALKIMPRHCVGGLETP